MNQQVRLAIDIRRQAMPQPLLTPLFADQVTLDWHLSQHSRRFKVY